MMTIETALTRLLGIDYPIVQAGMSWASSSAELPLAVTNAGGLGVLAAGPMRMPALRTALADLRHSAHGPYAVNLPLYRPGSDDIIDLLLAERIPVLIASQGGPKKYLDRFHSVGTRCLHVVSTVEHAVKAADAGVDGLIVVGGEAGGHPPVDLVSTMVIVRAVRKALPHIPIVASGGFTDGESLAAAIALGADGAQFGTRFIATPEANVHPAYREKILDASINDTRTVGRGLGLVRVISNTFSDTMHTLEEGGATEAERRDAFTASSLKDAAFTGNTDHGKVEAGQSAGLVNQLVPAGELVRTIAEQYIAASARISATVGPI